MTIWTEDEIAQLRAMWMSDGPVAPIGEHSVKAAQTKAWELGLRRHGRPPRLSTWRKLLREARAANVGANEFCLTNNVSIGALLNAEKRHGIKLSRNVPRKLAEQTA